MLRHLGDGAQFAFGVPSSRRARRTAAPSRSIGYFSRSRSRTHSRFAPSESSTISSTEFPLPMRPTPHKSGARPPLPDYEPLTEPEDDGWQRQQEQRAEEEKEEEEAKSARVAVFGQHCCAVEGDCFRVGEYVARLPCGCVFHRDCILPFILRARGGGYCPLDGTMVARAQADGLPVWQVQMPTVRERTARKGEAKTERRQSVGSGRARAALWRSQQMR